MSRLCKAPWTSISTTSDGQVLPCCRFALQKFQKEFKLPSLSEGRMDQVWNGKQFQKLRQAFLDGVEPEECDDCWSREDAGLESMRQTIDHEMSNFHIKNSIAPPPQKWNIHVSNVCNLRCRMCGPEFSSLIQKELAEQKVKLYGHKKEEFDAEIKLFTGNQIIGTKHEEIFKTWIPHIQIFSIAGGEPFKNKEIKKLVKIILQEKLVTQNIDVSLCTNGSYFDSNFLLDLFKFRSYFQGISIDDLYERNEYARDKSKWETIETNILKFKHMFLRCGKNPNHMNINCTVNNYNIWYLDELIQWAEDFELGINFHIVHETGTGHLSPKFLHPSIKEEIIKKYKRFDNNPKLKGIINNIKKEQELSEYHQRWLNWCNMADMKAEDMTDGFLKWTAWKDSIRKQDFTRVFPEWYDVLKQKGYKYSYK